MGRERGFRTVARPLVLIWTAAVLAGCGNTTTQPGTFRFGQQGEVRVHLVAPIPSPVGISGELEQVITWRSTGQWRLTETVRYRGEVGDSTVRVSAGDPSAYASSYASFVTQVNETQGLKLFIEQLDPDLDPQCGAGRTRISVRILDENRNETTEWVRCAVGFLSGLDPADAGPQSDPAAGRVIQAARLVRDYVLGDRFVSTYSGTVPFGTLARLESSPGGVPSPEIFLGSNGKAPTGWGSFRSTHLRGLSLPLEVDWKTEMVVVAAVGEQPRAGHEAEVRRIVLVDQGTRIEVFHRQPGNFCTPASVKTTPFHVVVAPRTADPVRFQDQVQVEFFTCGV